MVGHLNCCSAWWRLQQGEGPVIGTAIHDGHGLRAEVAQAIELADAERLREEDPFTGEAILGLPTHIVAGRSRFEIDLNRERSTAVYRTSDQCWGLELWESEPDEALVERSLQIHDAYYAMLGALLEGIAKRYGRLVLLDIHSYNHRRDGPDAAPTPQIEAPDVNVGTFSMPRDDWAWLLDPLIEAMRDFDFGGRKLDVRENVAFQGKGEQTHFVHRHYAGRGCAIAIEFKKFFMDEWTGTPDPAALAHMRGLIDHIARTACELLDGG